MNTLEQINRYNEVMGYSNDNLLAGLLISDGTDKVRAFHHTQQTLLVDVVAIWGLNLDAHAQLVKTTAKLELCQPVCQNYVAQKVQV